MRLHVIHKKVGQTPLEALESFRKSAKISSTTKLTYAGRLDPMASGVLLILEGATQTEREKYLALPKVYRTEILFGFATDSFDLLGIPTRGVILNPNASEGEGSLNPSKIKKILKTFVGKTILPIPPYSSVIYKGKPLFTWARAGKIKEKDWPKRPMGVKSIKLFSSKQVSGGKVLNSIQKNVKKVKGDFRQKEILKVWKKLLSRPKQVSGSKNRFRNKFKITEMKYKIITLNISCSSGTYIRSLANELGKKLKTTSVLFSLNRLSVGKYKLKTH